MLFWVGMSTVANAVKSGFSNRLHFNFMAYSMASLLQYSRDVSRERNIYIYHLNIFETCA